MVEGRSHTFYLHQSQMHPVIFFEYRLEYRLKSANGEIWSGTQNWDYFIFPQIHNEISSTKVGPLSTFQISKFTLFVLICSCSPPVEIIETALFKSELQVSRRAREPAEGPS